MPILRILVCSGVGIATSTIIANKIKQLLKARGINVNVQVCETYEVAGMVRSYRPHAIISTTQLAVNVPVKVFDGLSLLSGVGNGKLADEIAFYLKSVIVS